MLLLIPHGEYDQILDKLWPLAPPPAELPFQERSHLDYARQPRIWIYLKWLSPNSPGLFGCLIKVLLQWASNWNQVELQTRLDDGSSNLSNEEIFFWELLYRRQFSLAAIRCSCICLDPGQSSINHAGLLYFM